MIALALAASAVGREDYLTVSGAQLLLAASVCIRIWTDWSVA
jgi:hypothetical protein